MWTDFPVAEERWRC